MHMPTITAFYLAVLALLYVVLSLQVIRLRRMNRAAFGDSGNVALRSAIRAHAHFAEYVPITALMIAFLEASGTSALRVHLLMGALLVARLLHPLGMYAKPNTFWFRIGRTGGVTITIALLMTSALSILSRFAVGGS
ncbi:MAPEG family protein [Bradyrhizobium sp.]|uniref:MAPEG family protein n=1 Tax=Bradyrhizobium sp. TaxID=376 RepID=UPI0025B9B948|nr:MAPEG family protein [Bradyrhizobium sp.]MBV8918768.1 MAPEG family protein [Bradyrhizobium sp.]